MHRFWLKIYFAESKKELEEKVENYDGWICSGWVQQEQIHVDVIPAEIAASEKICVSICKDRGFVSVVNLNLR